MPGKPHHGKSKRYHQSKKSKAIRRYGTTAAPPAKTEMPAATVPAAAPPSPKVTGTPAKAAAIQNPYVKGELRRIALFAAIAVIILIILSFIIS